MAPSPDSPPSSLDVAETGRGSSTAINVLIGVAAGIILSFIPLSPMLGGGVASYFESGKPATGLKIGAIVGAILLIPFVLIGLVLLMLLGFGTTGAPIAFGIMAFFLLMIGAVYTIGLSAAGGYLGIYLKDEL